MQLTDISGIGPAAVRLLKVIGVESVEDLVQQVPRSYVDYSQLQSVQSLKPGPVTLKVRFSSVTQRYSKKGLHITEALASDDSGGVRVMWFNQRFRAAGLKESDEYFLSGEYAGNYKYLVITNPTIEKVSDFPLHTARLVPKYRLTKGLSVYTLRKYIKSAFDVLPRIPETLPTWLVLSYGLIDYRDALFSMHFPGDERVLEQARRRLAFQELFEIVLASEYNKQLYAQDAAVSVPFDAAVVKSLVSTLPFQLTDDQRRAVWEIITDMEKGAPMNRLLEGDVGSGKTVVAAAVALNTVASGFQVAFMAPTELLAQQHADTLHGMLPDEYSGTLAFLSGSMSAADKKSTYAKIANGTASIIVGTHALFQDTVTFQNLGLVVVDEQHRFGVEQRASLQKKAHTMPHVLHMTATPIPRSLLLTLYGELSVSVLKQKPGNRTPPKTTIINPERRQKLYERLTHSIEDGSQAFVVAPRIESETDSKTRPLGAVQLHEQIAKWMKPHSVELLHGSQKQEHKSDIMRAFVDKQCSVLVSTTVIEVGVDVPNARTMIIEGADRFGLAQLHQLRGRVGRGEGDSHCVLVTSDNSTPSKRLRLLTHEHDGFVLAEHDLELRGPGALYGTQQHGALDLRVAKISDTKLIVEARQAAQEFIEKQENLLHYPQLERHVSALRKITNLN